MSKDKKIYLVYIIGDISNDELKEWLDSDKETDTDFDILPENYMDENIWFYGFTTSKKQIKNFMCIRNEKKFLVLERYCGYLFKDDTSFAKFKRRFRKCEMVNCQIFTRGNDDGKTTANTYDLTLTEFEQEFINISFEAFDDRSYELSEELSKIDLIFGCMTSKMKMYMKEVGFVDFIIYLKMLYQDTDSVATEFPTTAIDELVILINYFGELFKGGIKEE